MVTRKHISPGSMFLPLQQWKALSGGMVNSWRCSLLAMWGGGLVLTGSYQACSSMILLLEGQLKPNAKYAQPGRENAT